MKKILGFLLLFCCLISNHSLFGQTQSNGDYQTAGSGNWSDVNLWLTFSDTVWIPASHYPTSTDGKITIMNGHTVNVDIDLAADQLRINQGSSLNVLREKKLIIVNGSTTDNGNDLSFAPSGTLNVAGIVEVQGTALINGHPVSGPGTFTLLPGATIKIRSAEGISSTGATGAIQTTFRNFSSEANYSYEGSAEQVTGNGLPLIVNDLTINNSMSVKLTRSVTLNGKLSLANGLLILGENNLLVSKTGTVSAAASSTGSFTNKNMVVAAGIGVMKKEFTPETGTFVFPVGDNDVAAEYSPVTLNISGGTFDVGASVSVNLSNQKYSENNSTNDYLKRYWVISSSGINNFSCDASFQYDSADVAGNESNIYLGEYSSGVWGALGSADTTTNTFYAVVKDFGVFTGSESSALPVELTAFNAAVVNNKIVLTWSTATEVNNYGFEIERKTEAQWEKIAFVAGHGSSNSPQEYSFTDVPHSGRNYYYRIKQIDNNGGFRLYEPLKVSFAVPSKFKLMQNTPNPFNPSTAIKFQLPENTFVNIKVYDQLGREVATLTNEVKPAGSHIVYWNGKDDRGALVASGIYIYRISAGNYIEARKMNFAK